MAQLVISQKGATHLIYNGHRYRKHNSTPLTIRWRCAENRACKGSATTLADLQPGSDVKLGQEHSHVPDPGKTEVYQARSRIREQAIERAGEAPRRIISDVAVDLSQEARGRIGPQSNLKRSIQRKRNREQAFPTAPTDLANLDIPGRYRNTADGRRFLLHDSKEEDEDDPRIIIFATDEGLRALSERRSWAFDGTFKIAPQLFYQLFTVHCLFGSTNVPCVYALLPNKTRATYQRVFQILRRVHDRTATDIKTTDITATTVKLLQVPLLTTNATSLI